MLLNVFLDGRHQSVDIPPGMSVEAEDFFDKMDADMGKGWQMSREWVAAPNLLQRCQIVADKLMAALESDNEVLTQLMAAYIVNRMPGVTGVRVNAEGEMQETELLRDGGE